MERPQEWVRGHESAQEMLRRVLPAAAADAAAAAAHSCSTPLLPCLRRLSHGHAVVEVAGSSGSAKSVFLLEAAVKCLLPKQGFGGWEGGVLWFDLDGHFDILRLLSLLQAQIQQGPQNGDRQMEEEHDKGMEDGDQVLKACLDRFIYTRCYSSLEFISALQCSRSQLSQAQVQRKSVRLLLIDRYSSSTIGRKLLLFHDVHLEALCIPSSMFESPEQTKPTNTFYRAPGGGGYSIAAFYWLDRAAPSMTAEKRSSSSLSVQGVMQAVVRELRNLSHTYNLLVMASKCNIYTSNSSETGDYWSGGHYGGYFHKETTEVEVPSGKDIKRSGHQRRDFMPAVWQEFVTHRLLLQCQAGEAGSEFITQWLKPPFSGADTFIIHDDLLSIEKLFLSHTSFPPYVITYMANWFTELYSYCLGSHTNHFMSKSVGDNSIYLNLVSTMEIHTL